MMEILEKIGMVVCLMMIDYVCVLIAVIADLRSGVMKAKRIGESRTSSGYRRTVEKMSRYYVTLMALTVIDVLFVGAVVFLEMTNGPILPPLPIFTTLGAVGLCMIEVKSIYENSQVEGDYDKLLEGLKSALKNPNIRDTLKDLLVRGPNQLPAAKARERTESRACGK